MSTENPNIFLKNNFFLQFFIADRYRIYRHITACGLLLLFFLTTKEWGAYKGIFDHLDWIERWLVITIAFYLNLYVLIPQFLFRGKLINYAISLVGVLFVFQVLTYYLNSVIWREYIISEDLKKAMALPIPTLFIFSLLSLLPFIMTSTFLKIFQSWIKNNEKMQKLERQAAESELQALRSQIQPHFLFNMLNSINVLVHIDPEKASYTLVKLSDFLRHLPYQSHEERVFLSSELRFLTDYLSLEAMRRDDFTYELTYDEKNLQGIQIPPNILLILAENAVKHSTDSLSPTYIYMKCENKEGWLHFSVRNSVPLQPNSQQKFSGIGLPNLRRRLELLYGDHFGISQTRNPNLAPLVGKTSETWSNYDNAMMQRVPYMVVVPGMDKGKIIDTYGGQVDMLPTLEHLLGIDSKNYLQVGQDLLSSQHQQITAFRSSNNFVTPKYTSFNGRTYYTQTGEEITNPDETIKKELDEIRNAANTQLKMSDAIQTGDLIRFYKGNDLGKVNPKDYSYLNSMKALLAIEKEKGDQSTSLYSKRGNVSTVDLFNSPSYRALHPEQFQTSSSDEDSSQEDSSSSSSSSTANP